MTPEILSEEETQAEALKKFRRVHTVGLRQEASGGRAVSTPGNTEVDGRAGPVGPESADKVGHTQAGDQGVLREQARALIEPVVKALDAADPDGWRGFATRYLARRFCINCMLLDCLKPGDTRMEEKLLVLAVAAYICCLPMDDDDPLHRVLAEEWIGELEKVRSDFPVREREPALVG